MNPLPLIRRHANHLITAPNRPWRGIGCNCYYLAIDNTSTAIVDEIISAAADIGLNVIRLWAFHDGPDKPTALQSAPGVYIEERFALLDYTLDRMARFGIRAILALTDYWGAYGGMQQWVNWFGGGHKHDFYTRPSVVTAFRTYLRDLTGRTNTLNGKPYRDDPAILAWQLANEPRFPGHQSTLTRWITETASFLRHDLAVQQLITTGMEGFDSHGTAFVEQHTPDAIDIAGFHVYPDHWRLSRRKVHRWIESHLRRAKTELQKPVMLDEYGRMVPPNTIADRDQHFRDVLDLCEREAADVTCFWMLYETGHPDFDHFGVYHPHHASTIAILRQYAARVADFNAGTPQVNDE